MLKGKTPAFKWLIKVAKPIAGKISLLTLLGILISYISVCFAMASRDLLDFATGEKADGFVSCVLPLAFLLIADITAQSLYNILSVKLGAVTKNRLQKQLFSDIMLSDYGEINNYHTGELVNRLTRDIRIVSDNIIDLVPTIIMLVSGVVMSFAALCTLDLTLALVCVALGPIILLASVLYGRKVKSLHKATLESDGKILSFMQEVLHSLLVIKAFRKEKTAENCTAELQKENYRLNMKVGYISLMVNVLYFLALTAAYYFAVAWCAYKIRVGIMTVGSFAAIIQLVSSVQSPFREISGSFSKFFATCASAERIMEIEAISKDKTSSMEPQKFKKLTADNISFAYGEEKILEKASFEVESGDVAVVTAPSGEGKSTLFKLLMGIYEPSIGAIQIHTENEKAPKESVRSYFSYVPQGNLILSGTIAENITFFDESPDKNRMITAANCACIHEYIETLPDGYQTILGEGGLGLSEGQIQRLAVARAIYSNAPVILLDEATSSLDEETECKILRNIRSIPDKTCIIITHRPAAINVANKHLCIEDGKIAEVNRKQPSFG